MDEVTHKKNFNPVNIRDLFMDKSPSLAPWIPGFIYRFLSRKLRIDFMNDLLTKVDNMEDMFIPINKHGAQAIENVRRMHAIFESDEQVMTFPAGLVSRRRKGVIRDTEWQKSIISKAKQSMRDLVPLHVTGRCSNFFYNLANLRRFLGIKTNIEMFFLPNESYKHRNKHFTITVGKPIPYETFDSRFNPKEWAALVQDYTYSIGENNNLPFSFTNK